MCRIPKGALFAPFYIKKTELMLGYSSSMSLKTTINGYCFELKAYPRRISFIPRYSSLYPKLKEMRFANHQYRQPSTATNSRNAFGSKRTNLQLKTATPEEVMHTRVGRVSILETKTHGGVMCHPDLSCIATVPSTTFHVIPTWWGSR